MTIIISGFPGIGKTTVYNNGYNCTDSDSSKFDKAHFPGNYIEHIKNLIQRGDLDYIFVSTHESVRNALVEAGIEFTVVYPEHSLKQEYMARYEGRGSPSAFLDIMSRSWDEFIQGCSETQAPKVVLKEGQFLEDVLEDIAAIA